MLPRWGNVVLRDWDIPDRLLQRAMGAMTSGSCKSLIALSESARNIASGRWLRRAKPADREVVESKLTVLRPPQRVIVDASERAYSDIPRFAFVGSEFYRKGGLIFLEAVNRLHDRGIRDWTATLVGRLDSYGDHATRSDASAERRARELIERLSPRVSHKRSIPKQDVTRLFGESDFAVLPSLPDSFGYGVLEAQACGAVAITTNIRAMPEMHIQDGGILVEMPLDPEGELHHDAEAMPRVIDDLVDRLEHTLETALSIPTESRRSRALAQQRFLRSRYDPAIHRATLERIYRAALGLSP
jgi:glycosyltransferase involved in cell wall biosynthesis